MATATSTTGFPDATTTGVPAGVTLKPSGSLVINTPGAVIEGLDIKGTVIINAPNVTLKNNKITSGDYVVVLVKPGITGAVIQNNEINNLGAGGQGIAGQGQFIANNIYNAADGIDVRGSNTLIKDNYIHGMNGTSASHYDGIQADGGFSNLQIIHNTVVNEKGQTSALMLDNYWGPIDNVKIDNNLFVGGGYTVYINEVAKGQAGGGPVTNVSFTNNHLGKGSWGEMDIRSELGNKPVISGTVSDGHILAQQLQTTGQPSGDGSTAPTPIVAPTIDSYSQDSGTKGDGITNDSTLTLSGKAGANSVVKVFDGTKEIGTATADSKGAWTYTTPTLNDGNHTLSAKVSDSAGKTVSSSNLSVTVDTVAPAAPTLAATSSGANSYTLKGAAEANSSVQLFDGATKIGTVTADAKGAWTYNAANLANGDHSFTAKALDAAGNTSAASTKVAVSVGTTPTDPAPTPTDPAPSTSGFPDATNTGVPAGMTLKPSGSLVINTPGAVIEGLDIKGSVIINAPNVTLKNNKITSGDYAVVLVKPGITGAVIQNNEINNLGAGGQGIAGQGQFIANNIYNVADGIDVRGSNTLIKDNFIHNMNGTSASHYDGIQADGGFSNLQIIHNTVINEKGQTSALMLDNYWGPIDNVKIDGNLFVGGGYTVYINEVAKGQAGGGPVTNVSFTNNHLGKGYWGEMDIRSELGNKPVISGNVSDGHTLAQSLQMTGENTGGGSTAPAPIVAPTIDSYSQDSGTKGDGITNDSTLTLTGKAGANAVVKVFDGTKEIGTATADSKGAWTYTTPTLNDGNHTLSAKVSDSAGKTVSSSNLSVTVDTVAPAAPTLAATSSGANSYTLKGAAEANSSVQLFDGATKIGTVTADAKGAWTYNAANLANGDHSFTAKALDAAGNTSAASTKVAVSVGTTPTTPTDPAPTPTDPAPSTSGFPDATNTGVPAGMTLKPSGSLVINTPGAVIEGLDIKGSVIINAPNVTLKNNKITSGDYAVVLVKPGITGAVIQNNEINNLGAGGQGIAGQGQFIANNIYNVADGIDVRGSNTLIKDNFIHNMNGTSASHYDGIQADGGFSNLQIIHNTVINEKGQTSALMLDNYWGPIDNVKIDGNLFVGGGYTVYINEVANGQAGGGPVTNVSFTNNHLGKGYWGEMDIRSELGNKPVISGNVSDGHTLAQSLQMTGQNTGGGGNATLPPTVAPTIDSYSQDSGTKGDGITNDSTLTLSGKAGANSVVKVFDGTKEIGTATADSKGAWTYTTPTLTDGDHSLSAKVTDSAGKTVASTALAVVIDTVAPVAPTIAAAEKAAAGGYTLTGAAEANSTIQIFDGANKIGTATADKGGVWNYSASNLADGAHSFTATAADAAGNISAASSKIDVDVNIDPAPQTASVSFTDVVKHWNGTVTFKGTADANSQVKIFDDGVAKALGTVKADANGAWSFTTKSAVTNTLHDFTAKIVDSSGNVTDTSGHAFVGSTRKDTIVSTSSDDLMLGGASRDTFVFKTDFGNDIIKGFQATGYQHDVVQFSKSVFSNFADVLSHATQAGSDVIIAHDSGDTLTLKNTKLSQLDKGDFSFV